MISAVLGSGPPLVQWLPRKFRRTGQAPFRQRTRVDWRSPLITPDHRRREAADPVLQGIGTVASGTGIARAEFVLRRARQAGADPALAPYTADVAREVNEACARLVPDTS